LKARVEDWDGCIGRLERAGAVRALDGRLLDIRFDMPNDALASRAEVLRVRAFAGDGAHAELTWKGAATVEQGFKSREEITTRVGDAESARAILGRLGFTEGLVVDRRIVQFEIAGAVVRLERFAVMDDLVEVEGEPEAIERAIAVLAMPRSAFTADPLIEFVARFERRTGVGAVIGTPAKRGDG
ncbi:MAG: class IV adenylate cyclase, partial [Gemmatimonadota bacterium]|nr:class IV adenylate cyclase [Gemmatimonadota bacterium]